MKHIARFLFETCMLKKIQRSGFAFLGRGRESVAEHSFTVAMVAFALARSNPAADTDKLVRMCLFHDLAEARTGDLNYLQKQYVHADESRALADAMANLAFGDEIVDLFAEFQDNRTLEARLAHDADQIALIIDLKCLSDHGYGPADKWLPAVRARLTTASGQKLAHAIENTDSDGWWFDKCVDTTNGAG